MLAAGQNEDADPRAVAAACQLATGQNEATERLRLGCCRMILAAGQNEAAEGRDEAVAGRCWMQVKMRTLTAEMWLLPADVGCRSK